MIGRRLNVGTPYIETAISAGSTREPDMSIELNPMGM